MNLFFIIAVAVLIGVALIVAALFKNAITISAIITWIVGVLLMVLGIVLFQASQWRGFGIGAIIAGLIVIVSGIGLYKWGKGQKKE